MAKSLRSKKKKRLRTLRREIAEPFYDKKEAAKLAAQEAALAAPKLPVRTPSAASDERSTAMDVEMADGGTSQGVDSATLLKPVGSIGKNKMKKQLRLKKMKKHGRGKIRKSHRI
ncbi:hypothetical protein ACMD2_11364 [Ananas comosus]|uniref:Uncharacterized protein n=1 Tax=Ananas comosus TaxID=4615 RepID=A0A199VAD8_ANACO|nr:hypothetical protein ACMD2_11364 [Ananas comosus]